ncbi:transcription repressor OFP13 [Dendrobium catenatum]|uniref:Transcription repressor n=1 Tax=Dendrobium catenatum TaxID=906689 RepID=A0A2I0WBB5_9ASPA|nr:transcription repressor OFP13 [Dendrobium catenatum]PKU72951.1 hypothetical protein MA16_Dca007514 [Dendrobium catenatum]
MGKLKSSIKSIQESITSFKPTAPSCIQEAKTHSFRAGDDPCSNFSYVYHTPSSFSSPSSLSLHKPQHITHHQTATHMEDSPSSSSFSSSSSSLTTPIPKQKEQTCSLLPNDRINPKRFFFSPRNTNSIMEEVKEENVSKAATRNFFEESEAIAMVSDDPYRDFKSSMAEMVKAHELRDWPRLQELLHCYLQLNDRKNHKIIVLAFVDLLMHLMTHEKHLFSFSSPPLCLSLRDLDK